MAKWAMYLIDVEDGTVFGTNDTDAIDQHVEDSGKDESAFLIIHNTGGLQQQLGGEAEPIVEIKYEEEDEDEDEEDEE